MTGRNTLKARIEAGETVTAAWLEIGSPDVAELLVHCGWDVIVIDCEHGTFGLEEGLNMIRAVEAAGGQAIVRVPDAEDATLKRALDRGAQSIMVPMVQNAEMARRIAGACLYPPRGRRGYAAPIVRASSYGAVADYARAQAHAEILLMVQIEHPDAIDQVVQIAEIEGIDMVFIGPNDMAAAMGHIEDMDRAEVHGALARIEEQAREGNLMLGTVLGAGRDYAALKKLGYGLVVGPCDIALLADAARAARRSCNDSIG